MSGMIYTLKNAKGLLGVRTESAPPYIVGFHSRLHAYLVRDHMCSSKQLSLLHTDIKEDVAQEVEMGLLKMGVLKEMSSIHINLASELTVPKKATGATSLLLDVLPMDYGEFILNPFERRIGVIEALSLASDTPSKYVFISNVIHPVDDADLFRATLK
jgi:hypothetical protein